MDGGFILAMLLLGLASGVHCFGMCGGIVAAFSLRRVLLPRRALLVRQLVFNAGRLTTYAGLGALAGAAGGAFLAASGAQVALYVLANVVLVLAGLHLATGGRWLAFLEGAGAPLWRRVQPLAARLSGAPGVPAAYGAGLAWGALPCGLLYGALVAATFAGSPAGGAAAMFAFGAGTLPWLLAAGCGAALMRAALDRPMARAAAGGTVIAFGAWGLAHAAQAGAAANAFFCL